MGTAKSSSSEAHNSTSLDTNEFFSIPKTCLAFDAHERTVNANSS